MGRVIDKNKLLKVILGFSFASWISAVLNFIILPISTRYFEPDELAKINLFIIVVTIVMTLVTLGLDQGYIRFFYEKRTEKAKKNLMSACLFMGIISLIIITTLAFPFRNNLTNWIFGEVNNFIYVFLFLCILNTLVLRYISILHRLKSEVLLFTISTVSSIPLLKVSILIAAVYNADFITATLTMANISLITLLIVIVMYKNKINFTVSITRNMSSNLLKFSIPLMPISVITLLNSNIPLFLLKKFDDLTQVGLYSVAITLAGIITLLQSGLNTFWSPFVFNNFNNSSATNTIRKIHKIVVFVMVIFAIIIIMLQDGIVILLGHDYRAVIKFLPLLLILPVSYTIAETTGIGIALNKKSNVNLLINIVSVIINIVACYILIPLYSVKGAAIASVLSAIVMVILKTFFGQRYYKNIEKYRYLIVAMLILLLVASTNVIFTNNIFIRLAINISALIGLCLYFNIKLLVKDFLKGKIKN